MGEPVDRHPLGRIEEPRGADGAFALAFLVERGAVDAFGAAVARFREQAGDRVRIRFVGPLPPYSFADDELRAVLMGLREATTNRARILADWPDGAVLAFPDPPIAAETRAALASVTTIKRGRK